MIKDFKDAEVLNNIEKIFSCANEVLNDTYNGYIKKEENALTSAEENNREIITLTNELYKQIKESEKLDVESYSLLYSLIGHFQKLKFDHDKLINSTFLKNKNLILFTDTAAVDIEDLFQGTRSIYNYLNEFMITKNPVLFRQIFRESTKYELVSKRFVIEHEERLLQGICSIKASTVYIQMLDAFEDILWHLHFIAEEMERT